MRNFGNPLVAVALLCAATSLHGDALYDAFRAPPQAARPWCYWYWVNGNVDEETASADLEAMKKAGFGGILLLDPRGYDKVVKKPEPKMPFGGDEWRRLVVYSVKECARLGLEFTMNLSDCGGSLKGPWLTGEDGPKRLVVGVDAGDPPADFKYYHDIATFTVRVMPGARVKSGWRNAGGVVNRWSKDPLAASVPALEWHQGAPGRAALQRGRNGGPDGEWHTLRFGYCAIPKREHDVDVIDAAAVERHFNRIAGPLFDALGPLVGTTFTHVYSVSWEGAIPTWTGDFADAFRARAGYDLLPDLPVLAGFTRAGVRSGLLVDYRRVRNDLFRDRFYGTVRRLAHARGVKLYSECGGPWNRDPSVFREADQFAFLGVNDMPQGENWPIAPAHHSDLAFNRPAANAAHIYGLRRASAEAFTLMDAHYSMWPERLKRTADDMFVDGVNHVVWHTFTASPKAFGKPGIEYFAGTHINRNVTWFPQAHAFISYLARCQVMLQAGEPVTDIALYAGHTPYQHWGRWRDVPWEGARIAIPRGYNYDILNDETLEKRKGNYPVFVDASGDSVTWPKLPPPDFEGDFNDVTYPLAEFGDVCYLANGASVYGSFVTDIDFTFAGQTTIKCSADSPIRNNSKSYTQAATVRQMRALVQREATLRELAYNDLEQRLDDVGGLYYTAERQQDGSYIYYLHNEPTIAASGIIWKMTKDALGVSTDGGNTWNAGLTVDGNLIANILNANGVNADWIRSGSIEVRDGSSTLLFSVDKDTGNVYISGDRVFIGDQTATQALGNLSGALAITLSNEMQGIPVDDQGHYDTFPNVETDIRFIYGGQDVTDAVNVSYSEFNVSGNLTYDSTNHVYTYTPTALTDDTGYVTFSGTYSAQTGSVSVTRRFNLYKAYAGPEGTARIYYLESDCDIVKLGQDNAYYPQTVTFSAFYRDGKEATRYPYSGLFEIQVTTDGTNWETVVAPEENKTAQTYTITGDDIQDIRCKFYSQATFNDIYFLFGDDTGVLEDTSGALLETAHVIDVIEGGVLLDIKTVPIVEDVSHLTQEKVFNILTDGGSRQGIYLATDPSDGKVKVYINAEYLATGILRSHDGSTTWNLDTGAFRITPNTIVGNGSSLGDLQLNVSATAEGLQTEVTARQNGDNSLSSRITQNANSISSEVTAREGLASRVTQTENTISTQVLGSGSTSLKSQIQQNASDISTKVSAGDVESAIEQNAQSIRLRATKIAWSASKSSMTENGVFSAQDGNFSGTITSSTITGGTVKNSNKNSYMVIKDGVLDVYRNVFDDLVKDYRVLRMTVDDYYSHTDLYQPEIKVATQGAYPRDFSSGVLGETSTYNNQGAIYAAGGIHFFKANNTSAMFLTATDAYFYQHATFAKNVWCKNKLYVQEVETIGKKSRSVDTEDYGRRRLYCYETPSPMFGDVGEGTINEDGLCYVPLDPTFSETISTSQYQVFLQSYGDGACYVQERKSSYFIVAGTPGLTFGWEIKGKQIDYDQVRLERSIGDAETDQTDYGEEALGHINEINEGRVA